MSIPRASAFPAELPLLLSDPPGLRIAGPGHRRGRPVAARDRYRHRQSPGRALLPWAAVVLLTFAIVNMLLARMMFAWLERWLAQRRTREIMGILFFLCILSLQLIGPLIAYYEHRSKPETRILGQKLSIAQKPLPPGLAAAAIAGGHRQDQHSTSGLPFCCWWLMGLHSSGC